MENCWLALQVRVRSEELCARILRNKGYEEFLPVPRFGPRGPAHSTPRPLFPGYVFCKIGGSPCGQILTTPGVIRIVAFGGVPAPVSDEEIRNIRLLVNSDCCLYPSPFLRTGQHVQMIAGPLCGVEGILLKVKNQHRLVLSIDILQRSTAVEIDAAWLEPSALVLATSRRAAAEHASSRLSPTAYAT